LERGDPAIHPVVRHRLPTAAASLEREPKHDRADEKQRHEHEARELTQAAGRRSIEIKIAGGWIGFR